MKAEGAKTLNTQAKTLKAPKVASAKTSTKSHRFSGSPKPSEFAQRKAGKVSTKTNKLKKLKIHKFSKNDEIGYFAPKTWAFWRSLIASFCLLCILGHWLEAGYCVIMDSLFGIVEDDYAIWIDPWYHPYWVYGFGAVFMTLFIEPLKERIVVRRKTLWGAMLETFAIAVFLSMAMELIFGLLINQPDEFGEYPYWDNSSLPLNVFGQAWLVNDIFIGFGALVYVWVVYPLICEMFLHLKNRLAGRGPNVLFGVIVGVFCLCCLLSYTTLIMNGVLG